MPALYAAAPRTSSRRPASRRVLTSSAIPWRRSRSGSVSSRLSSRTTRAGQWNAPTRFFPSGMSMPVLPPIAASTWPTSVVGTATHGTPRRYVAAANPATSVVQPPPRATTVPPRSSRSSRHSRVDDRHRLRLLPRRQLVLRRRAARRAPPARGRRRSPSPCCRRRARPARRRARARRAGRARRARSGRRAAASTIPVVSSAIASAASR